MTAPRKMIRSHMLRERAERLLPGGVDSPVRAFRAVGGEPPFLVKAEGACLWDADGNQYLDYFGSWGPMILGHAFPPVIEAIQKQAAFSTSFGASTPSEGDLAELVVRAYPSMEKLRFVSSGTEATMSALRLARAYTKRKYIVKFDGCYHGHSDGLLAKAGSGLATFGIPGSAGVPEEIAQLTLTLPFNNLDAVEAAFAAHRNEIACIIVEPVAGNMGCVVPDEGYLQGLRELTRREGALLIFDEVMTGFRVAFGGVQELRQVRPDLTTLGKIVGGGMPCGAFGGPAEIMDLLAPLGPVYQAGTLSGNPLAMAAGMATVSHLESSKEWLYPQLEQMSAAVAQGVAEEAARAGIPLTTNRQGSMFTWFFTGQPVRDYATAESCDTRRFAQFHRGMLDHGVWLPPSQFEAAFLGVAHTMHHVEQTVTAAREVFAAMQS
ncbi:glutamate-1-semialdehyde 2,1-aminomutase [Acidobacterium capsulatum]|nr:glutamate-1-semialdehyde 2,1-aminomutase [Acidobacterium capsulatum]